MTGPPVRTRAPQAVVILDGERRVTDAGEGVERILGRTRDDLAACRIDAISPRGGRGFLE